MTKRYRIYGITLATDYPFVSPIPVSDGQADVVFSVVDQAPVDEGAGGSLLLESPLMLEDGQPRLRFYQGSGYHLIRFTDVADFYLWPNRITCHLLDSDYAFLVEIHLFGLALSMWLNLNEALGLHASAVDTRHGAIGFLATNRGGKTSLAASVSQRGHGLLTDDVLAVRSTPAGYLAAPGYPQMRMWPDLAEHFLGPRWDLERFHPEYDKVRVPVGPDGVGTFCAEPRRLAALYLPSRDDEAASIRIESVPMAAAAIQLIRNTFGVVAVEAIGLHSQRLAFISSMLGEVPVRQLTYPSGLARLSQVVDAVLADVASLDDVNR